MKEKKPQLILYEAWGLMFDVLPDDKAGQLIKAIFAHVKGEDVDPIPGLEKVMTELFSTIDENMERYEQKREQLRANAKQRKANAQQMLPNAQQMLPNAQQMQTNNIKHITSNIEYKTSNIEHKTLLSNESNNSSHKTSRFVPPTLAEIKAYISEKGYQVDAESFFNFYESKGWMVGKNKMTKWKAAVANWNSKAKDLEHKVISKSQMLDDAIANWKGDDEVGNL